MHNVHAERLAPLLAFVAAVLAGVHAIDASPVGVFYDDAQYVILGRAIATGEGYRYLNLPGAPVATHFPPGYPALLALLWRISPSFPENIALFKMTNALLLGVVAIGIYAASRRIAALSPAPAFVVAAAATLTIPALLLSSSVMSEVLFLALLLPVVIVAERSIATPDARRAALLGVAIGALCLIRTHGIVLIPALAAGYLMHRRAREAAIAAALGLLVVLPWLLWVRHYDALVPHVLQGQYGSYGAWLADGIRQSGVGILFAALRDNVVTTYAILARSFSLVANDVVDGIAVASVLGLFVCGIVALFRRARVTVAFVLLYLATVLAWPFSPLRFIWGIWPLLALVMVAGAVWLWRRPGRLARAATLLVLAIVVLGAVSFNVRGYANAWWATVSRSVAPRIQPQLVWVTDHAAPDDVIVADDEGAVYLYTGRRAVPANTFTVEQYFRARAPAENARRMGEIIGALAATHVIGWAKPTQDAAAILAGADPPVLQLIDTIPTGKVYRVVKR